MHTICYKIIGYRINRYPEYGTGAIRDYSNDQNQAKRVNACIKCGASSGLTRGILHLNGAAARYRHPDIFDKPSQRGYVYHSQLEISGTPYKPFSMAGDSGAFVYQIDPPENSDKHDELLCIGMVVGGTSYGCTWVTPIKPILKAFNVSMCTFTPEETRIWID
jgi:hypothetical protein